MNSELVNKIKKIAIIALASDDKLIETIVLKGGNAIDLAWKHEFDKISRTSYDLDFSIEDGDFSEDEKDISERIEKTLAATFLENNYVVLDYKFVHKPKTIKQEVADFWGGYKATFKVIDKKVYDTLPLNPDAFRRHAVPLKPDTSPVFELEFSKYEYIGENKTEIKVDGYTIYVYTPEMIVFEKLRALCQQLPAYRAILPSHSPRPRARDFYDIHLIMSVHTIDPGSEGNKELIAHIFEAKKVPLSFIRDIRSSKDLHRDDWNSVEHTVDVTEKLEDFDFYFEYVLERFEGLTFP
ncbi:MAG: hypothetical protein JWN76_1579 [Chitinophagaceae bacterium]|nr:hypothetical protein [Chitinophagaceae bacterium]